MNPENKKIIWDTKINDLAFVIIYSKKEKNNKGGTIPHQET